MVNDREVAALLVAGLRADVLAAMSISQGELQAGTLAMLAGDLDSLDDEGRRAWITACVEGRAQVGRSRIILNALQVADADIAAALLRSIAAGIVESGGVE